MGFYTSIITKLLKQEDREISAWTYFLTLYLPIEDYSHRDIQTRLRSLVLKGFQQKKELKNLAEEVLGEIYKRIVVLKKVEKGLAVFVKFEKDGFSSSPIQYENITVIPFQRKPKREVYLGKTLDLDQLIWMDNIAIEALIVNLKRKKCTFYLSEEGEVKLFSEKGNRFVKEKEKEYLEKYNSVSAQEMYHGTGAENISRQQEKENRDFLRKIISFIKKTKTGRLRISYLIFFYSNAFAGFIDRVVNQNFPRSQFSTILINKNMLEREKKIKSETQKEIRKIQRKIKKDLLESVRSNPLNYVRGWERVVEALQQKKIETLFIDPALSKKGYILYKDLIYLKPVKDARMVRNITAWLVRRVIKSGGRVLILQEPLGKRKTKILARLRC